MAPELVIVSPIFVSLDVAKVWEPDKRPFKEVIPSPIPRHVPSGFVKHPAEIEIPFANVEVADVDVTLRRFVWMPPVNVEVADVVAV